MILQLVFGYERKLASAEDVISEAGFSNIKRLFEENQKLPSVSKTLLVDIIEMLSADINFMSHQAKEMLQWLKGNTKYTSEHTVAALSALHTSIVDQEKFQDLVKENLKPDDAKLLFSMMGSRAHFRPRNPTGHYVLNLANDNDYHVVQKLVQLSNFERNQRLQRKLCDTSEKGNFCNWRFERYNCEPFVYNQYWKIPRKGVLEFDYVSTSRPPKGSVAISEERLEEWMRTSFDSAFIESDNDRIFNFKNLCDVEYLTTAQAVALAQRCTNAKTKIEFVVTAFGRVLDLNYLRKELLKVLSEEEMDTCLKRLGYLNLYCPSVCFLIAQDFADDTLWPLPS